MTMRERVWKLLLDRGELAPSAIAELLGQSLDDVRLAMRDLCESRFVKRATDGHRFGSEFRYEVIAGPRYAEHLCEQRMAEADRLRKEQPATPTAPPHASLPVGPHMPQARRGRIYSPATHAGSGRPDYECKGPRHQRIALALREQGKLARFEIVRATGLPSGSVNARCNELLVAGYLIEIDETRTTPHGTPAGVLALNPAKPYPY